MNIAQYKQKHMYSGSLTTKMIRCMRCGKYKHPLLFSLNKYPDALANSYCEKCLSRGFENAYIQLRKEFDRNYLLANPDLIELKMLQIKLKLAIKEAL